MEEGAKSKQIDVKELHERIDDLLEYMYTGVIVELIKDGKVIADIVPTGYEDQFAGENALAEEEYTLPLTKEAEQHRRKEIERWLADWDQLAKEISKHWPEGVSAVDAVHDVRRDL